MQSNPTMTAGTSAFRESSSSGKSIGNGEVLRAHREEVRTRLASLERGAITSVWLSLDVGIWLQMTLTVEVLEWMHFQMSNSCNWRCVARPKRLTNTLTPQWLRIYSSRISQLLSSQAA